MEFLLCYNGNALSIPTCINIDRFQNQNCEKEMSEKYVQMMQFMLIKNKGYNLYIVYSISSVIKASNHRGGRWSPKCDISCLYRVGRRRQGHPIPVLLPRKSMDGGAWWAAVHGVAKSRIWLSDFTFTFYFHAVEKDMATHSSVLAWRIPGTGKPVGLLSMGLHRVGHDWSDLAAVAAWLRKRKQLCGNA